MERSIGSSVTNNKKRVMEKLEYIRLFDANVNRAKEGIRVVEDIFRFGHDDSVNAKGLKELRHNIQKVVDESDVSESERLVARDSMRDVGLSIKSESEMLRENIDSIFLSNIRRASESLRVLEEVAKLISPRSAKGFKNLRYVVYNFEKELFEKLHNK